MTGENHELDFSQNALAMTIGFKVGETVYNLESHLIPGTESPCGELMGTVQEIAMDGLIGYVLCSCGEVTMEKL